MRIKRKFVFITRVTFFKYILFTEISNWNMYLLTYLPIRYLLASLLIWSENITYFNKKNNFTQFSLWFLLCFLSLKINIMQAMLNNLIRPKNTPSEKGKQKQKMDGGKDSGLEPWNSMLIIEKRDKFFYFEWKKFYCRFLVFLLLKYLSYIFVHDWCKGLGHHRLIYATWWRALIWWRNTNILRAWSWLLY